MKNFVVHDDGVILSDIHKCELEYWRDHNGNYRLSFYVPYIPIPKCPICFVESLGVCAACQPTAKYTFLKRIYPKIVFDGTCKNCGGICESRKATCSVFCHHQWLTFLSKIQKEKQEVQQQKKTQKEKENMVRNLFKNGVKVGKVIEMKILEQKEVRRLHRNFMYGTCM